MQDQGAGGGVESRLPSHDRTQSEGDARPSETVTEAISVSPDRDEEDQLGQENPRGGLNVDESNSPSPTGEPDSSAVSTPLCNGGVPSPSALLARFVEPPVTKATLSELDVHKIIQNPKLRHDINFDPELHFRPNLDGDRGRKKQERCNQFWALLLEQLHQFVVDRDEFYRQYRGDEWCLPSLLRAVKEIIQTLVPQRDRELVDEGLNVELLMQQFNRGIADLERLALWLSRLLKSHCAPMRDHWVDQMYNQLSDGNRTNNMEELVQGMRSLLSVLEAMKLDVANHQIRCLRPVLIEDTVHFERGFFIRKVQAKKMCLEPIRSWYRDMVAGAGMTSSSPGLSAAHHVQAFGETAPFFHGLARLVLPSTYRDAIPMHFLFFDEERIHKLRSDMYDSVCLEICMRKFDELDSLSRASAQLAFSLPGYDPDEARRSSSGYSADSDSGFMASSSSRPSSLALSDRGSDHFSPRNSAAMLSWGPADVVDSRSRALALYASLLALLHTANPVHDPVQRWRGLAEPMGLQLIRFVNVPSCATSALLDFEDQLLSCLCDVDGDLFRRVEADLHEHLVSELAVRVKEYRNLSGVGIFSAATGGRVQGPSRGWDGGRDRDARESPDRATAASGDLREEAGLGDMATRLAHLGMLHWRVWAPLAYVDDSRGDDAADASMGGL